MTNLTEFSAALISMIGAFNPSMALLGALVLMAGAVVLARRRSARRGARQRVDRWVEKNWMAQHISSR